jgi:SOS response regulatory protein OraA/RecX
MQIEICSLSAAGENEIAVSIEMRAADRREKRRLVIPSETYIDLRLEKGECSRELYDTLEREAEIYAAYRRGVSILGYGACSKRMLISKLIAKGIDRSIAPIAVERIEERGYIAEDASARREAERCAAKLWGESRIRAHLASKGYGKDAVDDAMFSLEDAGVDFEENCVKLVESKCKCIPTDRLALQKLIASISRYGYSLGEVKSAINTIANKKSSIYD